MAATQLVLFERDEFKIRNDIIGKHVASPPEIQYWSGAPFRLGPTTNEGGHAVKYSAVPHQAGRTHTSDDPENLPDDYLTQALVRDLQGQEAVFDFRVQRQTHPVEMPVEDSSAKWDETKSQPVAVATLRIPPQKIDGLGDLATRCEAMSFNPWHALVEHRAMGGMNRLRKVVYLASVIERHPGE